MGQPWTNKHIFLAIAITRFCNFHFVNILLRYLLSYTSEVSDLAKCLDLQDIT